MIDCCWVFTVDQHFNSHFVFIFSQNYQSIDNPTEIKEKSLKSFKRAEKIQQKLIDKDDVDVVGVDVVGFQW